MTSESGTPTGETIWEVTQLSPDTFGAIRNFLVPSANYRFAPQGEGRFTFQSDWGGGLVPGYTRDGTPLEGGRSYPSWGTVFVQEPDHRVLNVREYFVVPKRGWLASAFTSGFLPGEYVWFVEYGFVNIGEQPYWLAKQATFTRASSTDRVVQTYDNCRRFQVKSTIQYGAFMDVRSTIRYGNAINTPSSQPGLEQVAGGMGGDPTPPLETGLEVDESLDSAGSPNIPPHVPLAPPEPPLSKAVQTSPSEDPSTPWLSRDGDQDPVVPSQTASRLSPKRLAPASEEDREFRVTRRGYYAPYAPPPPEDEREFRVTDYIFYKDYAKPRLPEPEKDPADDRSGFWWVLVTVFGAFAAAFAGSFFGNSLRGKRG